MKDEDNRISFKIIWSAIMAVVYLTLGYLVIFTPYLLPYNFREANIKENDDFVIVRIFLGIAMFLYGFFRGYRVVKFKK